MSLALYYLETSALVKLYVQEIGTERLQRLISTPESHQFAILAIARAELRSAVRRREQNGDIDKQSTVELLEAFEVHLGTLYM